MSDKYHIREIYVDRANSLLRNLDSSNIVDHGPTIGALREAAIISSLRETIPYGFEMSQGFVVDAFGGITPQIDIITFQRGTLSPLLLANTSALVPVELFRFGIEVKSRITRQIFSQVKEQAAALAKLQCSAFIQAQPPNQNHTTIGFQKLSSPFLLVAATSELSTETLENELRLTIGLLGIVVFDRCILYKGHEAYVGTSGLDRVLRFFSYMFQHCVDLSTYVSISDEMERKIFDEVQLRHPELDLTDKTNQQLLLNKIRTPSLLTYLYPPIPNGAA